MTRRQKIHLFVQEIWEWFDQNRRDLPWRDLVIKNNTERAYRILVSEVMLQQTQVARVTVIYKRFLETFPKLKDLAAATNGDVVMAWRGMGYNSRALRLRDAVKEIVRRSEGERGGIKFPREMEELMTLPGIGYYTAAAIRNFAFNIPTPCIEVNIRRVLHTKFVGPQYEDGTWKKDDAYLLSLAANVLFEAMRQRKPVTKNQKPETCCRAAADWHAALMDYGSLALPKIHRKKMVTKKEPGRFVGSTYIPNRIFRGRIVEELRDASNGLTLGEVGKNVCIDWNGAEHLEWLRDILAKLEKDELITKSSSRYVLR